VQVIAGPSNQPMAVTNINVLCAEFQRKITYMSGFKAVIVPIFA